MSLSHPSRLTAFLLGLILLFPAAQSASALDPDQAVTQHSLRVWRKDQGLPHDSITAIAQTPDGYLWCGTEHGLARFDGKTFTLFDRNNTPALSKHSIHTLMTDSKGRLWIGTGGSGVVRLEEKQFLSLTTSNGLKSNTVYQIVEDARGAIWIANDAGLSRYHEGQLTHYTEADGLPSQFCRSLSISPDGRLWVGTLKGLCCFSSGKFVPFAFQDRLPKVEIRVIKNGADGSLWIGTLSEIYRWNEGQLKHYRDFDGVPFELLNTFHLDRDGNLWVATKTGLRRWRDGKAAGQFPKQSPVSRSSFALCEDTVGNLWVGTADGLVCLANSSCFPVTEAEGLGDDNTISIYEDRKGQLWVGTLKGLSVRRNGKWQGLKYEDGFPNVSVYAICEDANDNVWFGTSNGLVQLHDGHFKTFTTQDKLRNKKVLALLSDRKGNLWIGTGGGEVFHFHNGLLKPVPNLSDSKGAYARVFYEDSSGAIWIGTSGAGLYVVRDGEVTHYTSQNGLANDYVLSFHQEPDGTMWISSHGGGLTRIHKSRWIHFDSSHGLSDDVIYRILDDGAHLWLSSTKGIFRVRKDELKEGNIRIRPLLLGKNDGMPLLDCNGGSQSPGCRTRDGWLWFPTDRGIMSVNPAKVRTTLVSPMAIVDQVVADGKSNHVTNQLTVEPGRGELEFRYTAIDLSDPENLRFRYKLQGYDSDWVEAGDRRSAFYTNLPPQKYRFLIKAGNGDGNWQETPAVLELILKPHFYQTVWFYALCILIVATMVVSLHTYRTRQHRLQKEILERCVEERTSQLQSEIEQHARTGEQLRQAQKLEAVGQLAGGIAHDFNNLLTVINGYTELILEAHQKEPQEQEMLGEMLTAGRRAAELTQQLLAFSRRQVLTPKILDPNTVVEDVQRMIVRLIGENITLKTALDMTVSRVKADPVQLQQVLINLCVNARDAMPNGGTIKISTRNVFMGPNVKHELPELETGTYVLLEVSDTGCGMSDMVRSRIFEPFFTTKGLGEGTGLGLATVYGIVRQSGGHVAVSSEVSVGTTFRIYLPCADGDPDPIVPIPALGAAPHGAETVLLVEDEQSVLAVARHLLLSCGYHVLEAEDGQTALNLAKSYDGPIDMLVSDVIMPQLSGRELAEELRKNRPHLRVLFVSGYTDDVILRHGVSEADFAFLQKPYSPAILAAKVREVLDRIPVLESH